MTRKLWFLFALLAALTFCQSAEAQPIPTWKNDAQGRPAPPCMLLDAATGVSVPCSTTNPIPTGGGTSGQGTTSGTSTTGFGKIWFPSSITGSVAAGEQMIGFFLDDINVAYLRRSTGCGNCLQVATSTDGGVSGTFFSTSFGAGNSLSTAYRVPSSPPRYLFSNIGGPFVAGQSASLSSGWANIVGLAQPATQFLSNANGSTTLVLTSTGANVQVCRSTDQGQNFGGCALWGAAAPANMAYAGGTVWLFANQAGEIWRSTNDGVTFALAFTGGGNGRGLQCQAPGYTTCLYTASDGNVRRSTDAGVTWPSITLSGLGTSSGLCDFGSGNVAAGLGTPPVGLATIALNVFSSFNAGISWFAGQTTGSHWDGTGVPSLRSMDCRSGRGIATYSTTGGGTNVFALYNPLTSPGGTLSSSAGGYSVVAPIQAGINLNVAPTTSAANTAAAVTKTGVTGTRICVREIVVFSSAAGAPTLTVTDGGTTVLNYGTLATGTAPTRFSGTPLMCGQTSASVVVNVGAAGAGVTTTTSVIADRYPN